jgi:hypothetical protein
MAAVADLEPRAELTAQRCCCDVRTQIGLTRSRVAEERRDVRLERTAGERRNPAIDRAVVGEILVAQRQLRPLRAGRYRHRRIETGPTQLDSLPENARALEDTVEPRRDSRRDALPEVERRSLGVERSTFQHDLVHRRPLRLFRHAIQHAAAAAAPEDHRVRPLQRLDTLDVVEVAEVLHVVPNAIDEEVRGRAVAADRRLVAVSLSLTHRDAGNQPHDVSHALHRELADGRARDGGD